MEIRETYAQRDEDGESTIFGESEWHEPFTTDSKRLFRELQREYGRCISRMYVDRKMPLPDTDGTTSAHTVRTLPIGWVFLKRKPYEDAPRKTYLAETWVEVRA